MKTDKTATRRRFLVSAGAALSAPVALAMTNEAAAATRDHEALETRLAALEDANAIRALQRAYARSLDAGSPAAAAELFADPSRVRFDTAIRGLSLDAAGEEDSIEVAADRRTATARMRCMVRVETPIEAPGCTLVDMARLQGEGVLCSSKRRVLEQAFVRRDGVWKIESAELREA
jgi:hypothetical protein